MRKATSRGPPARAGGLLEKMLQGSSRSPDPYRRDKRWRPPPSPPRSRAPRPPTRTPRARRRSAPPHWRRATCFKHQPPASGSAAAGAWRSRGVRRAERHTWIRGPAQLQAGEDVGTRLPRGRRARSRRHQRHARAEGAATPPAVGDPGPGENRKFMPRRMLGWHFVGTRPGISARQQARASSALCHAPRRPSLTEPGGGLCARAAPAPNARRERVVVNSAQFCERTRCGYLCRSE